MAARPGPGMLQALLTAPVPATPTTKPIRFLHPGYNNFNNVLFRLARVNATAANAGNPIALLSVCHATALIACQIIANNA